MQRCLVQKIEIAENSRFLDYSLVHLLSEKKLSNKNADHPEFALRTSAGGDINAPSASYERDARGGTRNTEFIQFGVTSPDARLQSTEYLGGGSVPIAINPIAQTST